MINAMLNAPIPKIPRLRIPPFGLRMCMKGIKHVVTVSYTHLDVYKRQYEERKQLAILVSGRDKAENWLMPKSVTDFYMLKAYVKILLDKLNLTFVEKPIEDERFADALEIISGKKTIARLGKVSPQLLLSLIHI